jgi:outer membrane protein OmpA-like peptidoglycan-associated protein
MRKSTTRSAAWVAAVALLGMTTAGCAARVDRGGFNCHRRWGAGTVGGALAGAAIGGGLGGGIVATSSETERQAKDYAVGIGVGVLTGAALGVLFGHCAFDEHWAEEAPPPPPPPPPAPRPTPRHRQKIVLRGVNFDFNKSTIRRDAAATLDEAAVILRDQPNVEIFVDGYTDDVGSDAYNQRLSDRRAQAVVVYLSEAGVNTSRLRARGFGKTHPVASNATEEGRAENRRVELNLAGSGEHRGHATPGESYKEKRQRLKEQSDDEDTNQ